MKQFLESTQTKVIEVSGLQYVDEDWGQLDNYTETSPIEWPCCLIDISNADFSDIGTDKEAVPQSRQEALGSITLTFADLKIIEEGSLNVNAWSLQDLIEEVHGKIHGFTPVAGSGKLIRKSLKRVKRDDGIQQYDVVYTIGMRNI
jgi:hypothetical protein